MLAALVLTGCKKEMYHNTFLAVAEPTAESRDSKTELVDESVVVWKGGDQISVRTTTQTKQYMAEFSNENASSKAVFETEAQEDKYNGDSKFIALFPYSENDDLGTGDDENTHVVVDIPQSQTYVNDNTFGGTALPMVAYGGVNDGSISRIQFHNLAGLVRLQLCSDEAKSLSSISFQTTGQNYISGGFEVMNFRTNNPTLTPNTTGKGARPSNTLTIDFSESSCTLGSEPKTFYVPLPAQAGDVSYSIMMTVNAGGQSVQKSFTVPIRRNAITKMPVLRITSWENGGSTEATIAGNGTKERPFLIYTVADLKKVRDVFNTRTESLNGKEIWNEKCYFHIMTSTIVLTKDNWPTTASVTRGAMQFNGHLVYNATQNSANPGIENSSEVPLFYSISEGSTVTGLTVRGNLIISTSQDRTFSPFCLTNNGEIKNCHVSRSASYVMDYDGENINDDGGVLVGVGGICVTNSSTGKIKNCGCASTLVGPDVAGICLDNQGSIKDCYAASPMLVFGTGNTGLSVCSIRAAGVCYKNGGTINGCYFAANSAHPIDASWGGIAYYNAGDITNCYIATSGVMQSNTSVGGIVHTMTAGTLDYCRNDADVMYVLGGSAGLGGIVNTLNGANAEVRNCIRYSSTGTFNCVSGPLGGVVALLNAGKVYNSAFYGDMSRASVPQKGAFVGRMQAGTIANCYAIQTPALGPNTAFVGSKAETNCTIAHCYGQIATTGVELYDEVDNILEALNGWTAPAASTYFQWDGTTTTPPILNPNKYISTSKRRR